MSTPVRDLILRDIPTISHLEVLLLLRRDAGKAWTAREVGAALYVHAADAGLQLLDLQHSGLVGVIGAEDPIYWYSPRDNQLAADVADLAAAYASRRMAVIGAILHRSSAALRTFADAFKLRGDK